MESDITRDMPECEQPRHDVHEPTTYELADAELNREAKRAVDRHMEIMRAMFGDEKQHKYYWDAKRGL